MSEILEIVNLNALWEYKVEAISDFIGASGYVFSMPVTGRGQNKPHVRCP